MRKKIAPHMIGIIYNPVTNSGNSADRMRQIRELMDSKGIQYEYMETLREGHATEIAKEMAANCDIVVAAGGDGTVFEVVNGIYGTQASMMIMPLGSGNDIARSAGVLELTDEQLVDLLVSGKTRPFDCFTVNGELVGLEFVTFNLVVNIISMFKDPANISKGYGGLVFKAVRKTKGRRYMIKTESGEQEIKGLFISAQNIKTAGGGLPIYPAAEDDDGMFDMIITRYKGTLRKFLNLMSLSKGKLCQQPNVTVERVKWVEITPLDGEETYILDGEFFTTKGVRVEIAPEKIKMLSP